MEIKTVPIESIFVDPANARKHPQKNMDAIKGSISKFQQVEPLVVQKSKKIIIGGNGRYQAMKELGFKEVQIVEVDLTDTQAAALAISLNRTGELAEWDLDVLPDLLLSLHQEDFDLASIGFDDGDLKGFGIGIDDANLPEIDNIDELELSQMTFTFHKDQINIVERAIEKSKAFGEFGDTGNENSNGNAMSRICELFLGKING